MSLFLRIGLSYYPSSPSAFSSSSSSCMSYSIAKIYCTSYFILRIISGVFLSVIKRSAMFNSSYWSISSFPRSIMNSSSIKENLFILNSSYLPYVFSTPFKIGSMLKWNGCSLLLLFKRVYPFGCLWRWCC